MTARCLATALSFLLLVAPVAQRPAFALDHCQSLLAKLTALGVNAALLLLKFQPRTQCGYADTQKPGQVKDLFLASFGSLPLGKYSKYVGDTGEVPRLARAADKPPVDKRLSAKGKTGFPVAFRDFARVHTGSFDAAVTFAVGDVGLKDGGLAGGFEATGGTLRLDRPPFVDGGPPSFSTFVQATYFAAQNGFRVIAFDGSNPILGTPVLIANADEVDLRIQQTDTTLAIYARATPADRSSDDGWQMLSSRAIPVPATPFSFGLALQGLDAGATGFFDFFTLSGPDVGGATERPFMNQLASSVFVPLGDADAGLAAGTPDLAAISAALGSAATGATAVATAMQAALDGGSFQAPKTAKAALGFAKKADKAARAAQKIADKGDGAKAAAIEKKVLASARAVILAVSNLAGFKAGSMKDVPFSFAAP